MVSVANLRIDLSLEFLMGRALDNAMLNVEMKKIAAGTLFNSFLDAVKLV